MMLLVLNLFHEYLAKSIIPYYKLKFDAREAANRLIENRCLNFAVTESERNSSVAVRKLL